MSTAEAAFEGVMQAEGLAPPGATEAPGQVGDGIKQAITEALQERSPWLNTKAAIRYSALPEGSFRKLVANGRIRQRGSEKRHIFHRAELDEDLRAL
jgi:hypothetical protein